MRKLIIVICLLCMSTAVEARRYHRSYEYSRPSRWCGWYMRTQVGRDPGPAFNLARNWARYGSAARGPAVGTIVVWRSHVGRIVGFDGRNWVVHSGNDSNRVRTRARSVRGAIAFRWDYNSRYAYR